MIKAREAKKLIASHRGGGGEQTARRAAAGRGRGDQPTVVFRFFSAPDPRVIHPVGTLPALDILLRTLSFPCPLLWVFPLCWSHLLFVFLFFFFFFSRHLHFASFRLVPKHLTRLPFFSQHLPHATRTDDLFVSYILFPTSTLTTTAQPVSANLFFFPRSPVSWCSYYWRPLPAWFLLCRSRALVASRGLGLLTRFRRIAGRIASRPPYLSPRPIHRTSITPPLSFFFLPPSPGSLPLQHPPPERPLVGCPRGL